MPHLSPTMSGPLGVTLGLAEQGKVSLSPVDQVATTVWPATETSRCLMYLSSLAGPLVAQSPVMALGCLPWGQSPASQTLPPPLSFFLLSVFFLPSLRARPPAMREAEGLEAGPCCWTTCVSSWASNRVPDLV